MLSFLSSHRFESQNLGLTPASSLCNLLCQTLHLHVPNLIEGSLGTPLILEMEKFEKGNFDWKITRHRIDCGNVHAVVGCGWHSWMAFLLYYAIPLSEDRPRPLQTNALMPPHETNPIWMCWIKVYLEEVPVAFHIYDISAAVLGCQWHTQTSIPIPILVCNKRIDEF